MSQGHGFAKWQKEKGFVSSPVGRKIYIRGAVSSFAMSENGAASSFWKEVRESPKTFNGLWLSIVSFENLYKGYQEARKLKRFRSEILRYEKNLEERLIDTQNRLIWHAWSPGKWKSFITYEPKKRVIQAPPFTDRVVHHALVRVIEPLFEKKFIYDSYACRKDKGTHAAHSRVVEFLRSFSAKRCYVLQTDIRSYFPSIDHDVLMGLLQRTIRDKNTLWLLNKIVRKSGFEGRGIPIGALTSQLFANIYLNELDHFVKDDLGIKRYLRYMDDALFFSSEKASLKDILIEVRDFLRNKLKLELNPKTHIYSAVQGVNFCGYRTWATHTLPRKRNVRRAQRKLRKMAKLYSEGRISIETIKSVLFSWLGYMQHCNGHKTVEKFLQEFKLRPEEKQEVIP